MAADVLFEYRSGGVVVVISVPIMAIGKETLYKHGLIHGIGIQNHLFKLNTQYHQKVLLILVVIKNLKCIQPKRGIM